MPDLPSGTVTFAFTDIEDSTALLLKLGDLYGDTLAEHRRLVREAFSTEGVEIDTQGDAFFFAFPRARDAVTATAEVQRAHAGFDWPHGAAVRVRIGLHTGEPHVGDEGYLGLDVVRAARICTAARGGQVLLSEATRALLGSSLPPGLEVYPRGERQLKGIDEPERIFELEIEGAPVPEEEPAAAEEAPAPEPAQATSDDLGKRLGEAIEQHVARRLESVVKRFEPEAAPVGDDEAVETLANRSASLEETISQRVAAALREWHHGRPPSEFRPICKGPGWPPRGRGWAAARRGGRAGGCMHARFARYTFSGNAQEIARKAEEGALPIFKSLPGFKAYSIAESDGEIFSFSVWETFEQAEAANIAVADWVAENLADDIS